MYMATWPLYAWRYTDVSLMHFTGIKPGTSSRSFTELSCLKNEYHISDWYDRTWYTHTFSCFPIPIYSCPVYRVTEHGVPHRKLASAGISRARCRAGGHDKRYSHCNAIFWTQNPHYQELHNSWLSNPNFACHFLWTTNSILLESSYTMV